MSGPPREGAASHSPERDGVPAVEFREVSKAFGAMKVLDRVSFGIPQGSVFCLLGRSGTGKSVTLKHIIGLMKPDEGAVLVEGEDITRMEPREITAVRRKMGFLFQNSALFDSISVGENVAFPMRRHTRLRNQEVLDRAREKLKQVGLEQDFDKMPGDLSGGMRKRAGLARAMALDPAILLVDEPSAGLDPVTSEEIDELLKRTQQERHTTLVVVTHNIPSARMLGDELAFIHEGRILERGTAEALEQSEHDLVRTFMRSTGSG
jgi:phospholipid/cholesterol/gamma-HCH transport system ATP-binding protein